MDLVVVVSDFMGDGCNLTYSRSITSTNLQQISLLPGDNGRGYFRATATRYHISPSAPVNQIRDHPTRPVHIRSRIRTRCRFSTGLLRALMDCLRCLLSRSHLSLPKPSVGGRNENRSYLSASNRAINGARRLCLRGVVVQCQAFGRWTRRRLWWFYCVANM